MSRRPENSNQGNPDKHTFFDSRTASCLVALALLATGCPSASPPPPAAAWSGRTVRVHVVGDAPLAAELRARIRLWEESSGAKVQVSESASAETAPLPEGDVVILPSAEMGAAVARGELLPWEASWTTDPQQGWEALPETIRYGEMMLGEEVYGVPLGTPVFLGYFRDELFSGPNGTAEKAAAPSSPPVDWKAWDALARSAQPADGNKHPAGWKYGSVLPLGDGWAGLMLLARAAPEAKHPSHYSTLFETKTMKPLLTETPFVEALAQLVELAKLGPPEQLSYSPQEARACFLRGEAALAVTWPLGGPAGNAPAAAEGEAVAMRFAPLPGSPRVWHHDAWETRLSGDDPCVPLIGCGGRVGCVRTGAASTGAAWAFLTSLRTHDWGKQVRQASLGLTIPVLEKDDPGKWLASPTERTVGREYVSALKSSLEHGQWLDALRIPGRSRYLAALDRAVQQAVRGEKTPAEALAEASAAWKSITAELGLDAQRTAYRRSLGLR